MSSREFYFTLADGRTVSCLIEVFELENFYVEITDPDSGDEVVVSEQDRRAIDLLAVERVRGDILDWADRLYEEHREGLLEDAS